LARGGRARGGDAERPRALHGARRMAGDRWDAASRRGELRDRWARVRVPHRQPRSAGRGRHRSAPPVHIPWRYVALRCHRRHGVASLQGIALDPPGNVYRAGTTSGSDFPGTAGGAQPSSLDTSYAHDGIVVKLSGDLRTIMQSTFVGGVGEDGLNAIALDPVG